MSPTQQQHSKCKISLVSSYHFLTPYVLLQWHLLSPGHPPKPCPQPGFLFIPSSRCMLMVSGLTLLCTPGIRVLLGTPFPCSTHTNQLLLWHPKLSQGLLGCPAPRSGSTAPLSATAISFCLGDLDNTGEVNRVVWVKTVIIIHSFHLWIVASLLTLRWGLCG